MADERLALRLAIKEHGTMKRSDLIPRTIICLMSSLILPSCAELNESELATAASDPMNSNTMAPSIEFATVDDDPQRAFAAGSLGTLSSPNDEHARAEAMQPVLDKLGMTMDDLELVRIWPLRDGSAHYRYREIRNGLEVFGSLVAIHVNEHGVIYAANARTFHSLREPAADRYTSSDLAELIAENDKLPRSAPWWSQRIYFPMHGELHRAFRVRFRDSEIEVFIDTGTGEILAEYDTADRAITRSAYTYNAAGVNLTDRLPGTLYRTESNLIFSSAETNRAFLSLGRIATAYQTLFMRDGIDDGGDPDARVSVLVDLNRDYGDSDNCGARWEDDLPGYADGVILLGAGDPSQGCLSGDNSFDLMAHEYTHGVTEDEVDFDGSGEARGLDESYADVLGAAVEARDDATASGTARGLSVDTWRIGEDLFASGNDQFRTMCDPKADSGTEPDVWSASFTITNDMDPGFVDPHLRGNVNDLAVCLLARGGAHPRGSTHVSVPGIGFAAAADIAYRSLGELDSNATFASVRAAMAAEAAEEYGPRAENAVHCAYAAIGVGATPANCNHDDLLWYQSSSRLAAVWRLNASGTPTPLDLGAGPSGKQLIASGDFDADGDADILWRNEALTGATAGEVTIWLLNGASHAAYSFSTSPSWKIVAVGDFDGGGTSDLLWRSSANEIAVWRMDGAGTVSPQPAWSMLTALQKVVGTGDFNRDGLDDILVRSDNANPATSHTVSIWLSARGGGQQAFSLVTPTGTIPNSGASGMTLHGAADLDGDGALEVIWRRTDGRIATRRVVAATSGAVPTFSGTTGHVVNSLGVELAPGAEWTIESFGDVNGDGRDDIIWRAKSGADVGLVAIWFMNGVVKTGEAYPQLTPGSNPDLSWQIRTTRPFD